MICPMCGNENPDGARYCVVCNVDFQTLPKDMFPSEHVQPEAAGNPDTKTKSGDGPAIDANEPVPDWVRRLFGNKDKTGGTREKMDFDDFTDVIFGRQNPETSTSPEKVMEPQTASKSAGSVYQPSLESTVEAPLLEEDGGQKTAPVDFPVLHDFKTVRPVKKWDDPAETAGTAKVREQADREFGILPDIPAPWMEDAPLIEEDGDTSKDAGGYDTEFANSVSPTKVIDSEETSGMAQNAEFAAASVSPEPEPAPAHVEADEFQPESGSLLSDLMNEMNSGAGMPAPAETKSNSEGTVFFSGNEGSDKEETDEPDILNIPPESETSGGSAAVLDQILRRIGYSVDDGSEPEKPTGETAPETPAGEETTPEPDPALVIESDEETEKKPASGLGFEENPALGMELDPALVEPDEDTSGKGLAGGYGPYDEPDDTEIPWDLFGSADMPLPQSAEEPGYKTFSRTGIPEDTGTATYQQRMLSSVLGKIIYAENFVPPEKKTNARAVSIWARLFWTLLAFCGVLMILKTDAGEKITVPETMQSAQTGAFWQAAETSSGKAMIIIDYTPSYASILDPAADRLIQTLSGNTDELYLSALNPAAVTTVRRILENQGDAVQFTGWWPAGVISIRSRLAEGMIPNQVWLVTSESGSVRNWAEQLSVAEEPAALYVLSPGQLEPLLTAYLGSEMIAGFSGEDNNSENGEESRIHLAVLYLTALIPFAWLMGVGGRFLKSDPDFRRKKSETPAETRPEPEKETEDD